MPRSKLLSAFMAGTIASTLVGGAVVANAKNGDKATNETAVMAAAKISMAQAIATAEQQIGGKAVGTGIEDQDGAVYFEVDILKDGTRQQVLIDPQSGKIVKTAAADTDNGENDQESDDD